jgi:hypothetical protein
MSILSCSTYFFVSSETTSRSPRCAASRAGLIEGETIGPQVAAIGLRLGDVLDSLYLDILNGFGSFQGKSFRGPGFGFESRELTIAHKRLYLSEARIV